MVISKENEESEEESCGNCEVEGKWVHWASSQDRRWGRRGLQDIFLVIGLKAVLESEVR